MSKRNLVFGAIGIAVVVVTFAVVLPKIASPSWTVTVFCT